MGQTKEVFSKDREACENRSFSFKDYKDKLNQIIKKAEGGHITKLDATIKLREQRKEMEAVINSIKKWEDKELESIAIEAADYPDGYKGYQFEFRNGRKLWDFKGIPEYNEHMEKVKQVQESAIAAFNLFQKTGQKPISEDGELLPMPDLNYAKSSLVVKPKKK